MQSDSPESDPRLQRVNAGPKVTTGFVDPCIFYLEATSPNEVPILFACWARSSSETRQVDGTIHLKLSEVSVVKGTPIQGLRGWNMENGRTDWNFAVSQFFKEFILIHDDSGWTLRADRDLSHLQFDPAYGCQSFLKFIDAETDFQLKKLSVNNRRSLFAFTKLILRRGPDEWPTLVNARSSFKLVPTKKSKPVPFRLNLAHLIYSAFKRKPKPVTA